MTLKNIVKINSLCYTWYSKGRDKMRKFNTLFVSILVAFIFVVSPCSVNASNDSTNPLQGSYKVKTTNNGGGSKAFRVGIKGWSSGTPYKGTDPTPKDAKAANLNAYCVSMNHSVGFTNGTVSSGKCVKAYTNNFTTSRKIKAGYMVELINNDNDITASDATLMVGNGSSTNKITSEAECKKYKDNGCDWSKRKEYARFVYKVVTLNTFMSKFDVAGSINFTRVNKNTPRFGRTNDSEGSSLAKKIEKYIDKANDLYDTYKASSSNDKLELKITEPSSKVMRKVGTYYITTKTFKFTSASKLKNGAAVSTGVSAAGPDKSQVSYCTDSNGRSCSSTASAGKEYYIKLVQGAGGAALEGGSLTIKIQASSSFKYPMLNMYCKTNDKKNQAIGIYGNGEKNVNDSKSFTLAIPATKQQTISVAKVDADGNPLKGATFELWNGNTKLNWTTNDGATTGKFSYTVTEGSKEDLSKLTITLKEATAPNGYKLIKNIKPIEGVIGTNVTKYWLADDDTKEITLAQYAAKFKCKITTTVDGKETDDSPKYKELDSNNSCVSYTENSSSETPTTNGTGSGSGNTGNSSGNPGNTGSESGNTGSDSSSGSGETPTPKKETKAEKVCYSEESNPKELEQKYCGSKILTSSNGNYYYLEVKDELTNVKISKVDATNNEEVPGASLKICSKADCNTKKEKCTAAKTIKDTPMEWTSGLSPREWTGLPAGDYCVVETVPPLGYKKATTITDFSVKDDGTVTSGSTKATDNTIVIKNALNEITVSKTDMATTKELPGATLSICEASIKGNDTDDETEDSSENTTTTPSTTTSTTESSVEAVSNNPDDYELVTDDVGDCVPVVLQDGSGDATWTSTDQPHTIKGLPSGTYYLVEKTAPNGYSTAESILFRMTDDGVLTDVKGNTLANNKIEMKDAPIKEVKTGQVRIVAVILICVGAAGAGAYYYFKTNAVAAGVGQVRQKIRKIKGRKLHK